MFKVGVVVGGKSNYSEALSFHSDYRFHFIASDPGNGTLSLVQGTGLLTVEKEINELLNIVHLCFSGMSRREVLRHLRFVGQHPTLFTRLAIVLCEIDASTGVAYDFISTYLENKCRHRLHIDYFLVLGLVHRKECGGTNIELYSGHGIINASIEAYYNKAWSVQTLSLALDSKIV